MIVTVAEKAGACYGVNRALELALGCQGAPKPVHTLGPLIHNPLVVASLAEQGVFEAANLDEAGSGTVVIRSHGTGPQLIEEAERRGFNVVDATCPFVSKVQQHAVVGFHRLDEQPGEPTAPKSKHVFSVSRWQAHLALHAIGMYAVERSQQPVQKRGYPQVLLGI